MTEQVQEQGAGRGFGFALWVGIALAIAGVAGYYTLTNQPGWIRWLSVAAGVGLGALVFGLSGGGREFRQFVIDARNELRKVFWPSRQETWMTTAVVFVFTLIAGVFFWLLDLFLAWMVRLLTGQGG